MAIAPIVTAESTPWRQNDKINELVRAVNSGGGGGGTGDMTKAVYDPQTIEADAFDVDNHTDGATNKVFTATEQTKLAGIEDAADVTDAVNVGSSIHGASAKGSLVDGDKFAIIDSAASNVLKTSLWSVVKSTLVTYLNSTSVLTAFQAAGSYLTASSAAALTNKTFDANGTGNAITNIETADFATNVIDTDGTLAANSDTRLASQKAVKTYVDAAAGGGSFTQLATSSASSTSVPFTTLAQTYRALLVTWSGISFSGAGNEVRLRVSTNNGSSYLTGGSDYYNGSTANSGLIMGGTASGSDTVSGYAVIHNYAAAGMKYGQWVLISSDGADSQSGLLYIPTANAIDAVQLTGDGGGTFDAGTITVYGIP